MRLLYTIAALALIALVIGLSINLGRERARLEQLETYNICTELKNGNASLYKRCGELQERTGTEFLCDEYACKLEVKL